MTPDGRVQTKRAATGQQNRVRLLDVVDRVQQIGFAGAGTGATNVHAGYGALLAEHNRASGRSPRVCEVPGLDSGDVGDESVGLSHYNRMLN